ncbi:MAG: hypothetical protein Q7T56_15605 [Nocardioidaceae bacterium]|nr:hypothetical protein [Nocardioidaceae bacterium]
MIQWAPPLLFVVVGLVMHVLAALGTRRAQRPGHTDGWDAARREHQASAMRSNVPDLAIGVVGAALGVAAGVAFVGGSGPWWLSAAASVVFVALVPRTARFRRAMLASLGDPRAVGRPDPARTRRTVVWLGAAAVAYVLARVAQATTSGSVTTVVGGVLVVVAFGALLTAAWSAVRTPRGPA